VREHSSVLLDYCYFGKLLTEVILPENTGMSKILNKTQKILLL